jgi:hypothetical protein
MLDPLSIAGMAMSGIGAGFKFFKGLKQEKQGNRILAQRGNLPTYATSPFAKKQLGMAQTMFNGRMAGAQEMENSIMQNQANFMGNVNRNATDGSQALALAAASQGMTNNAMGDLQIREAQNKYSMLDNLNNAYGQMTSEGDKVYQSQLNRYGMLTQEGMGLKGAGMQNTFGAMNDIAGGLFGAGQLNQQNKLAKQRMLLGMKGSI